MGDPMAMPLLGW